YVVHHGSQAFERIEDAFEAETGIELDYIFACRTVIGTIVRDSQDGDVCVQSGQDDLAWLQEAGLTSGEPVPIAELIPVIEVAKGNPKGIESLADLARPDVGIGLGMKKGCLGVVADALFEKSGVAGKVEANIAKRTKGECNVAATVDDERVDAAIVWASTVQGCDPDRYDTVPIPSEHNSIDPLGAVVLNTGDNEAAARKFIAFLQSETARRILAEEKMIRPTSKLFPTLSAR
ncbi:MAG: substrate-binding domain-containing protein, partial [bacterium]